MSDTTRLGIQITASDTASASIKNLQASIKALQSEIGRVAGTAIDSGGKYVAQLQAEIGKIQQQISAVKQQEAATKALTAAIKEQAAAYDVVHRSLQQNIDTGFGSGADRQIKSASESARVLATSLSAAAEADARFRAEQLETASATARATAAVTAQSSVMRTLTGEQFFGVANRKMGIGQQPLSAAASASAFQSQLGPAGGGISSVETQGTINSLQGINRELLSARDSAAIFQQELAALGTGVVVAGTKSTIDTIQGINREMLSAKDSAAAFQAALGPAGTGIVSSETKATIDTLHGINREMLSAKDSAAVFAAEMGEVGSAVTTVSSSGFSKMVADLADVKLNYLSAADSAKVFAAAGLTATETALGMTEKSVAASVAAERAASRTPRSGSTAGLSNEARHAVAAFDELARGQRGALFSTMGAAARDAGLGVGALSASVAGLAAVMGVSAILRGAEAMGKWATETRAAASAAGMSIEAYSGLQAALEHTGLKGTEADATLRKLAESLSTALSQPASLAAEAFHNLGISQAELTKNGTDTGGALRLVAEAFTKTADSANKTANMNEILGRGFEHLIPILQNGGGGLDELITKLKEMGLVLTDDTAAKLEDTGEKIRSLGETIRGNGIKAFEAWGEEIKTVSGILKGLIDDIGAVTTGAGKLFNYLNGLNSAPSDMTMDSNGRWVSKKSIGIGGDSAPSSASTSAQSGAKAAVPALTPPVSALEAMRLQMAQAGAAASGGGGTSQNLRMAEGRAELAVMQQTLATAQLTAKEKIQLQTEIATKTIQVNNEAASAGTKAAKQSYMDFASAERLKISEAQGSSAAILAIYNEWEGAAVSVYRQTAATIATIEREKVNEINKARLAEIKEGAKQDEDNSRLSLLNKQLGDIHSGKFDYSGQKTGAGEDQRRSAEDTKQAQQVEATATAQINSLQAVANAAAAGSSVQKEAQASIMAILLQSKEQEVELYKKAGQASVEAAKKIAAPFVNLADQIGGQLQNFGSSLVTSILAPQQEMIKVGMTTIKTSLQGSEIRNAAKTLLLGVVGDFGKAIETGLSHVIANALSGGAANTIGDLLGNLMSKAFSSIVGSVTGSAAGTAAGSAAGGAAGNAAGSAAGDVAGSSAVVAAVSAGATATTTGVGTAVATGAASIITAITAGAASTVAAIASEEVTEDALLVALNAKPSVLGFTYSKGGIVPSAAGGMVVGGSPSGDGQLSILHPKEMVLPANISLGIQSMIARGNNSGISSSNNANLNYSPTINTSSRSRQGTGMSRSEFNQLMSSHGGSMMGEARNMVRAGFR